MIDLFQVTTLNKDLKIQQLFDYWRKVGFPNYSSLSYDKYHELQKLIKFDESSIVQGGDLQQTMHGCGLLWTYFPHWVEVLCGDAKTSLLDNWNDDTKLISLIRKTYDWQLKHGNGVFTVNRLRQNSKVYLNKQSVSNFRPSVAKYIYNTYGNQGSVWDMSGGWGGRLFGFLASDCKAYITTEPSVKTYNGLLTIADDYNHIDKKVTIVQSGSEDYLPEKESLDLCFTSPPYFDTEKYSDEETQSYLKFPSQASWLEGYLRKTIENCCYGLNQNGHLIINIANTKSCDILESSTVEIVQSLGFELIDIKQLILSSIAGKGVKREPIFIFKKL